MPKPVLDMTRYGDSGNAFTILGAAQRQMQKDGASKEDIEAFMAEAQSGNYDNLLRVVMERFEIKV